MEKMNRLRQLAFVLACPFLLAFTPPQSEGTSVSASGGTGKYLYMPSCARPEVHEYREYQIGVFHAKEYKSGSLGGGLDYGEAWEKSKVCLDSACEYLGNQIQLRRSFVSPHARWEGRFHIFNKGIAYTTALGVVYMPESNAWRPRGKMSLGGLHTPRLVVEFMDGAPLLSNGPAAVGLEYRKGILEFEGKVGVFPSLDSTGLFIHDSNYLLGMALDTHPIRFRISGGFNLGEEHYEEDSNRSPEEYTVRMPEYRIAAGMDFKLPLRNRF